MYGFFDYLKRTSFIFQHIILLIIICNFTYAGNLIEVDGFTMYSNDYGEVVKDSWVWIDTNNDSIAECFRFDQDGHLAINYKDRYGRETNDKGELIENGEVIKKMLSNGEILKRHESPANGILEFLGNIINPKSKNEKDKWTKETYEINVYETNGIEETIDGKVLYGKTDNYKEIDILNEAVVERGVIYSSGKASNISDGVSENRDIVAGKDFRKFITNNNKCNKKVNNVYIYGGELWTDVLSLSGNGASVEIELNGNNYIRFEVAHNNHREEEDTNLTLDMFIDGKFYDSYDEFVDSKPQIIEEYLDNVKTVELKLNIKSGPRGRVIYIKNGRIKKAKMD